MCNCKSEVARNIQKMLGVDNGSFNYEIMSGRTVSTFSYRNAKGKNKTQTVLDSHCPFCGEAYIKLDEKESESEVDNV